MKAPGVVVIDDRASNRFPTPLEVSNKDDVAVGRIRRDLSQEGNHGWDSLMGHIFFFSEIIIFPLWWTLILME
jgi:hypothetical protein